MTGSHTALVPAEERGTTTLADVVVEKVAAAAAAEVRAAHGLRRHLVGKAIGRPTVRADVDLDGSVASLRLDLAVEYPSPVRPVTRDVRTHVTARVRELCDVTVDHIDITVAALPRPTTTVRRVR